MKRLALLLLLVMPCGQADAEFFPAVRDSIGVDGTLTDGLPGASTAHAGGSWNTPGMVVDVSETGNLAEVKFVMFGIDPSGTLPENSLANILGYQMDFHVWSDGIQGGPDSFFDNAEGRTNVPGHTKVAVNRSAASFISAQEFGITGPSGDPSLFTTFLVTIDLSSFSLQLQGGQQYVLGVTSTGNFITGAAVFRQTYSRATGFEDLFQKDDTPLALLPGFVNSQHLFGVEQLAGAVSMGNGNYDGDTTSTGPTS